MVNKDGHHPLRNIEKFMIFFVISGHTFQHDHNDAVNNDDQKDDIEPLYLPEYGCRR